MPSKNTSYARNDADSERRHEKARKNDAFNGDSNSPNNGTKLMSML